MSPIIEAMKPSPNSDRQSCASSGELFPKNGTAFATESPTTFVSSRPTIFGSSRRPGIARVDKVEEELRTQAFDRMLAQWERKYPASRRRAESNERLPTETKGLRAETDPKSPAEAQTIPAVTATESAPLLPPATDADYADAFVENMHI